MGGDTVVGKQYWAEDTSLWSASAGDDPGWGPVPNPDRLGPASQKIQGPFSVNPGGGCPV